MPPLGKVIIGVITRDLAVIESAQTLLEKELGPVENKSPVIDFTLD